MTFNYVYYFHVCYGWKEKDEYGFVTADDFEGAYAHLKAYYGDEILSYTLEHIGDTGLISVGNKGMAEMLKDEFTNYHYGSDKEDE